MKKINIYVEGNEKKFIEQLISILEIRDHISFEIFSTNGKDRIYDKEYPKLLSRNTDKEEANILIFDADNETNEQRKNYIADSVKAINLKLALNINIDAIFLLPDDSTFGCFESLLFKIMNEHHRDNIFKCLDKYQDCVRDQKYCPTNDKQRDKAKVYAYLEAMDFRNEEIYKPNKTNYLDTDIWNLSSPFLEPLKTFLSQNLLFK